jgi:PTH1 family peptidyl-tRNA hydrolase
MGWLIKQQELMSSPMQLYSLGQQKQILIVGLGNVGQQYEGTRHNIGFFCADAFISAHEELSGWQEKKDFKCFLSQGHLGDTRVIVIKPTTFMNASGQAVQAVSHFFKITPDNILVIHDELDILFGQIRMRDGGSSAGHNGIKSIIESIGESFNRLRIGIGPKKPASMDSADFVLKAFSKPEQKQLPLLIQEVNSILDEYVYGGQIPQETRRFKV